MTEHFLDGDWLVIEIDGETVDPDAPREVRFEGDRVSGRVGVNRFTGKFTGDGKVLQIGSAASTRMAGPPERMTPENQFNSRLQGEHEITREGDFLTLGQSEGATLLKRAPAVSVRGTVSYRERIRLPPDSVVMVDLVDISIADVAVEPIAFPCDRRNDGATISVHSGQRRRHRREAHAGGRWAHPVRRGQSALGDRRPGGAHGSRRAGGADPAPGGLTEGTGFRVESRPSF